MASSSILTQPQHGEHDAATQADTQHEAFWQHHINDWTRSGLTQSAYARTHDLVLSQFGYWKRKLSQEAEVQSAGSFVPVKLSTSVTIRITTPNGLMIECTPGTDVNWLKALLKASDAA